jgi:hypothetical protein
VLIISDKSGNGKGAGFAQRNQLIGTISAVGRTAGVVLFGEFNLSLSGTFTGSVQLERSVDGGITYQPITSFGMPFIFTTKCEETFNEPQPGVFYALNCTALSSGTIGFRMGQ